jgi:uncharacterized Ntn-hydrolase superfamily protein
MTWSIVARDPKTGAYGCAVATKFFAVGAMCIKAEGRIGALATQALINPTFGPRGLRLLREGKSADEIVKTLIESDQGRDHRQLHVIDRQGRNAAHTGKACVEWCGHLLRPGFSVAGNMMAGPAVIEDTAQAFAAQPELPLARRLIAAMKAGEAAGGDKRGKQSAALIVYSSEEYPELDLRVDDHTDPLAELERLEAVSRERFVHFRSFLPTRDNPSGVFDRATIEAGVAAGIASEAK